MSIKRKYLSRTDETSENGNSFLMINAIIYPVF